MEKNSIVIYNDQGYCLCDANIKPNDIFESGNIIITVGKKIMEVFEFSQINNKNNLIRKGEINIDNNNNNITNNNFIINNDNTNSDNEIKCITLTKGPYIICGHASGYMSIWQPEPKVYLKRLQGQKLHNGPINAILYAQLSNNKNYLFSCSSDKTIKIYCMEDNLVEKTINFEDEVMDIKLVKDFDQKTVFIVSLKNGKLKGYNESFDFLFDIPSRFNTNKRRYVLGISNLNQENNKGNTNNNVKGDFLLITEGKIIDLFIWIKEGSFKVNHNVNNNGVNNPGFQKFKGGQNFQPHYFQGNQYFSKGGY